MHLNFNDDNAKDSFMKWYALGEHLDMKGRPISPEDHPDIKHIAEYYNNEIAYGPAVEVVDD